MTTPWSVATTRPAREAQAAADLTNSNIPNLLFMTPERRVNRQGALVMTQRPSFPRYIFIQHDTPHALLHQRDLQSILGTVRPQVLAELASRAPAGVIYQPTPQATPRFAPGATVRITEGPLTGIHGKIISCSSERAVVELGVLGRVELDPAVLGEPRDRRRYRPRRKGLPTTEQGQGAALRGRGASLGAERSCGQQQPVPPARAGLR